MLRYVNPSHCAASISGTRIRLRGWRSYCRKSEGVALSAAMSGQSGYFAVAERDGILWLIDPTGRHFIWKGVNAVRFDQEHIQGSDRIPYAEACTRKYGGRNAWRAAAAAGSRVGVSIRSAPGPTRRSQVLGRRRLLSRLTLISACRSRGGRTNSPWSDTGRNFLTCSTKTSIAIFGAVPKNYAVRGATSRQVLGWFIDNELRWCPDWRGAEELLGLFLGLSPASAGRKAALDWLKERHRDFTIFNASWQTPVCSWDGLAALAHIDAPYRRDPPYQRRAADEEAANRADPRRARFAADCDDFAAHVAERYFALTSAAIKAADPHHLVLGARFAYPPPRGVIDAAGRHCDIVSFNCYDLDPGAAIDSYAAAASPA